MQLVYVSHNKAIYNAVSTDVKYTRDVPKVLIFSL